MRYETRMLRELEPNDWGRYYNGLTGAFVSGKERVMLKKKARAEAQKARTQKTTMSSITANTKWRV